ncbi:glycosyltransferase family 4 protein [uncultured Clostridium sp.]|uniref:glycosyltransferase family 4 protein n=1 Tax=uncultured Clostridium sp. TaxID=59620 RepID=UPI0025F183A3|nr:glycosyltransferase family 4 protein [uncultured Clostridium sp.]
MKVLFFVPNMTQVGGIERLVSILANKFNENDKMKVEIINLGKKNGDIKFKINDDIIIKYIGFDEKDLSRMNIIKKVLYTYKTFIEVKKYFKKYNFEDEKTIVIAFGHTLSLILAHAVKSTRKIKLIGSQHNPITYNKLYNVLRKIYLKKLDKYVVLNKDMKSDLLDKYNLNNIEVIENPNTLIESKISNLSNKQIISVGRLTEQKNYECLIEVWNSLGCKKRGWKLRIIGEGSEKENLLNCIKQYNLKESVVIESFTDNIVEKYYESDIFVLTSKYEGFGLVIVEAQSCGLPVISFDCPTGPRSIINDGKDGFLIESNNTDEFTKKLLELMNNEEVRMRLSKNAIENARRFDIDIITEKWIKLFNEI